MESEHLLTLRQHLNADSGYFEQESTLTSLTTDRSMPSDPSLSLGTIPKDAGDATVQVPVHNERYKQLLIDKVHTWLLVCEASRGESSTDLDAALQLIDAVDYSNLIVTVQMSTYFHEDRSFTYFYGIWKFYMENLDSFLAYYH